MSAGTGAPAEAWDAVLWACPRGQFQQASGWARAKALDGWAAERVFFRPGCPAAGGFQLLWKRRGPLGVGYVSKGPVLAEEDPASVAGAIETVVEVARRHGLSAVVLQPPDDSRITSDTLVAHGFFARPLDRVIDTTALIGLDGGGDAVVARMSRRARQAWRTARERGVSLAWGSRDDLPTFHTLMCTSARRQGQAPNPARTDALTTLWDALPGRMRLAFAERDGRQLAGLLTIAQRDRLVFWKKGWNAEVPDLPVNQFLMTECLVWAAGQGYTGVDLLGMSPDVAAALAAGRTLPEAQRHSRDVFNWKLGARPRPLPPAHVLILNRTLRLLVHAGLQWPGLRRALERRLS